jgi:hypothetical protein
MTKRDGIMIGVLVVVGCIYITFFSHWFDKKKGIVILASLRPARTRDATVLPVIFKLDGDYKLTDVKVVPLDNDTFKPMAMETWHLVAKSNATPTRAFVYGSPIAGMEPAVKGTQAQQLDADHIYRLEVAAGDLTGATNFMTKAAK